LNGYPHASDRRLSASFAGFDRNDISVIHSNIISGLSCLNEQIVPARAQSIDHLSKDYAVAVGCGDAKIADAPGLGFDRR
jgi:hypothetical protein